MKVPPGINHDQSTNLRQVLQVIYPLQPEVLGSSDLRQQVHDKASVRTNRPRHTIIRFARRAGFSVSHCWVHGMYHICTTPRLTASLRQNAQIPDKLGALTGLVHTGKTPTQCEAMPCTGTSIHGYLLCKP